MTKFKAATLKKVIRMGWQGLHGYRKLPVAMTLLGQSKTTCPTNDTRLHLLAFPCEANFR
jgi:hypothetical protein